LRPGAGRPSAGVSLRRINSLERDLEQTRGNPGGPATTQSETNISVFGPNVVVGYNNSATGVTDGSFSGFSVSNDGGRTWADRGGVPREAFTYNIGDPGLAVDRQGRFYYAQILFDYRKNPARGTLGVSRSTDGGRTFSRPVDIYPASPPLDVVGNIGEKIHSLSDKELIAVDNSGGPRDGTVYVAWNQYSETRFPNGSWRVNSQIWLVRSTDGGATWSELVPVSPAQQAAQGNGNVFGTFVSGAVLATGPNGEVYCAWEESRAESVQSIQRIARSDDGGATFALANASIDAMNNIGNVDLGVLHGGFRINEFPDLAIDRSSGALYLVYSGAPTPWPGDIDAANGADRSDIFLVRSSDRGATWSAPLRVNDDTTESDQFFPAVAVTPDGTVGVMFYDRRHDPYNQRLDVTFARSLDGGRSFRTNERVTATSFPVVQTSPQADPQISDLYMGDYIDMVADATSFHLAWGDNRDVLRTGSYGPRPDPNVYYTRIPSR
jgi:hypothetical protein